MDHSKYPLGPPVVLEWSRLFLYGPPTYKSPYAITSVTLLIVVAGTRLPTFTVPPFLIIVVIIMKLLFIFAALFRSVRVYAGGISTCLEMVYIYKGYLVDQFGEPKTIGRKCKFWAIKPGPRFCQDFSATISNQCLESLDRVIESREGDHDRYLLPAAIAELQDKHGIEVVVKTMTPGFNPFEPEKKWVMLDWAATKQKAYNNPTGFTH